MRRPDAFFTEDDWEEPTCDCHCSSCCECLTFPTEEVTKQANKILREFFEKAPEVYGDKFTDTDNCRDGWHTSAHWGTHRARLVFVEEIGK